MADVSVWRLNVLRVAYLLLIVGLGVYMWPLLINHRPDWPHMNGVVVAMLCALSALAVLGLRYPLQMIPLLLFELLWKVLWLGFVALPLQLDGALDGARASTAVENLWGAVFIVLIPWDYVFKTYIARKGESWLGPRRAQQTAAS